MSVVDYVATCSFMMINKKMLAVQDCFRVRPRASVVFTVEPDPSTCYFSMQDVLLNMSLPANPFDVKKEPAKLSSSPCGTWNDTSAEIFTPSIWNVKIFGKRASLDAWTLPRTTTCFPCFHWALSSIWETLIVTHPEAQHAAQVLSNNNSGKDE
ncbi:hypothetical protein JTE90_022665 [Oedothorax gibbosus]|uniref:Uncharacterized protein n=1 Tax=Oedothorax gibbosus TaxID=931172 RepID=A0AAV6TFN9_9ARAC|nr:hypothetical protein JTE90_022665 [Oedothorax gibbosus]